MTPARRAASGRPGRTAFDGEATRGKTAANRLRRTDTFLLLDRPSSLRTVPATFVDVGYGQDPSTTVETFHRLRRTQPRLRVFGVEIDAERVDAARPLTIDGALEFAVGGFELPVLDDAPVGFIRAMNVLRQYDEARHRPAIDRMTARLADGGVLLEGTSSPTGRLLTMNVYRRRSPRDHRLVLTPNLRRPWSPLELRTVLPKNLIHHAAPGSPLDLFFVRWERSWSVAREQRVAAGAAFEHAALSVAEHGYDIDRRRTLLRRGFLVLRDPDLLDP